MTASDPLCAPPRDWNLRVRLEADAPDFELAPGQTVGGVNELGTLFLRPPTPGGWRLEIDDEVIEAEGRKGEPLWRWRPGFFAGEVAARLTDLATGREAEYRIDVSPDPGKMGREVFDEMLRSIWAAAPELLVGEEPSRRPHGASESHDDPVVAYGRLRRHGPGFLKALGGVAASPIAKLRCERDRLPVRLIRRSDRRTALDLARVGNTIDGDVRTALACELLDAPIVGRTVDNAANRMMLAVLQTVLQRIRACAKALAERVEREPDSETRTTLRRRWPARQAYLRRLEFGLRRLRRSAPFAQVQRAEVSPAGLNAVSSHPLYARAQRIGWLCTRRGFAGAATADELWLPPTWEVYERWCWIALRRRLEDAGFAEFSPGRQLPAHDALWCGIRSDGTRATLLFQARFVSWSIASHRGGRSLSSELRPDIVLLVENDGRLHFQVFDAKYRTARQGVLDGMTSAHVYHDALRLDGQPPDRVRLLVPRGGGAPWLEDGSFQAKHGIGVCVLAPDADGSRLIDLVGLAGATGVAEVPT